MDPLNNSASRISGLYLLTRETADTAALLADVDTALRAGVRVLQYRDKSSDQTRRLNQAQALASLCRAQACCLIINDDVALAAAASADGVHLGEHDGEIASARAMLGSDCIIGVSCYNDVARARRAVADGADYVAFGAFHSSTTKPLARPASVSVLHDARDLPVPRVAIGGIDADNGTALIEAGADALAVLGAIWDADDIGVATRALSSLFSSAGISR